MTARQEYFDDLLRDCKESAQRAEIQPEDEGLAIAALVLSDSLNGLRKALLQLLKHHRFD